MGNLGTAFHASISSTVHSTVTLLLGPVQAVVSFFAPWQSGARFTAGRPAPAAVASAYTALAANSQDFHEKPAPERCPRRLRVLRVVDASCSAHSAGRMVISGRFADVCAELDRLSQHEAA